MLADHLNIFDIRSLPIGTPQLKKANDATKTTYSSHLFDRLDESLQKDQQHHDLALFSDYFKLRGIIGKGQYGVVLLVECLVGEDKDCCGRVGGMEEE